MSELVNVYMRRVRTVINTVTGAHNLQRWYVDQNGDRGWCGIPWPERTER